jgi:peptidoglycan/LPS O-acetylase OafA/YrhL
MTAARPAGRLAVLDDLRGFAALSVCIYHLGGGYKSGFASIASRGYIGVYVFFVISGFVLPHAMHAQGYGWRNFWRYLLKRLARLHPPFLASIFLVLGLGFLFNQLPGNEDKPFHFEACRFLTHLVYETEMMGQDWFVNVYWTLGIEWQYYLLIGALFPLLASRTPWVRLAAFLGCIAASLPPCEHHWVTRFLPLFLIGIWTFWREMKVWPDDMSWLLFIVVIALCWFRLGHEQALTGAATALVISYVRKSLPPLAFLGAISYSLYLTHTTTLHYLGGFYAKFGRPVSVNLHQAIDLAACLLFAWLFYLLFEKPSMSFAARTRYL